MMGFTGEILDIDNVEFICRQRIPEIMKIEKKIDSSYKILQKIIEKEKEIESTLKIIEKDDELIKSLSDEEQILLKQLEVRKEKLKIEVYRLCIIEYKKILKEGLTSPLA